MQVISGKAGDKAQGVSVADLCVLQDQIRASFDGMLDLKERLDKSDLRMARYYLLLCCRDHSAGTLSVFEELKNEMPCRELHATAMNTIHINCMISLSD